VRQRDHVHGSAVDPGRHRLAVLRLIRAQPRREAIREGEHGAQHRQGLVAQRDHRSGAGLEQLAT
jgi:hypothetical protein